MEKNKTYWTFWPTQYFLGSLQHEGLVNCHSSTQIGLGNLASGLDMLLLQDSTKYKKMAIFLKFFV